MNVLPDFYEPERIGSLFYPDLAAIATAATRAGLAPAGTSRQLVHLLIIDMQVDFSHQRGTLYVPGSEEDIKRLAEFIFHYAEKINSITCTLDSHLPFQIFHPSWWADKQGNHPAPLTVITSQDLNEGRWQPLVMPEWSREYVRRLEQESKKQLTIWPYHVLMGGLGNALDPTLWSVVMWHSLARKTQPAWLLKGRVPQTEHYSALQPEIPVPDDPGGGLHRGLLETVREADILFVAGEAQSHCVLETLEDIVTAFKGEPEQLQKIYVLSDCTSSVLHPEINFEALALEQFDRFAKQGVNFVKSIDPLPFLENGRDSEENVAAPVAGLQRMGEWLRQND